MFPGSFCCSHAYGLLVSEQKDPGNIRPRQFGFLVSAIVIGLSAISILVVLIV
jgi:hypothetical protein